jgi:hypothetical protein
MKEEWLSAEKTHEFFTHTALQGSHEIRKNLKLISIRVQFGKRSQVIPVNFTYMESLKILKKQPS